MRFCTFVARFMLALACEFVFHQVPFAQAQVDANDPFRGNYLLGESSEIVVLSGQNGNVTLTIHDAVGAIERGELIAAPAQRETDPWGVFGENGQIDATAGDLNGDGRDEIIGAWEGPNRTVTLYVPHIDPQTLTWSQATRLRVQDAGFPTLFDRDDFFLRRYIRVVAGQFDNDNDVEFVLAYWGDDGSAEGGPIQIVLYDAHGTLSPEPVAAIADERLTPFITDAGDNLQRGSRFDIATGDFDRDGTDEIILFSVEKGPKHTAGGRTLGWNLFAKVYDFNGAQLLPKARSAQPILSFPGNFNDSLHRLAIAAGDFNGDFYEEVVFGYELKPTNESAFQIRLQTLVVSADLSSVTPVGSPKFYQSGQGQDGWPMSMVAGDVNYDGRDEILHAAKGQLSIYKTDQELNIGSTIASAELSTSSNQIHHRTVALTDVDLGDTDSLRTDVVIMDNTGLHVYQSKPASDGLDLSSNPSASNSGSGLTMVVGDFDGDAVRLGPPSRQTRRDIVQPLVILNAPPIHFDIINGQTYDLGKCYGNNDCEHRATYQNAQSVEMEVATQVSADWGVSQSIEAQVGGTKGPISASIRGSLQRQYGEGFARLEGSSETVRVTVTSDAVEDDRVYATISNYDILEYPVYAGNELQGHVIAVVPQLTGVESLKNTWFASKSGNARSYLLSHEVGNIFSYRRAAELPAGAVLFGRGGFAGGGGDTWELSGTAKQKWELRFSSQEITTREQSAYQQVSRSLDAEISGGFGPFQASLSASVADAYGSEQISTHKTLVQQESALIVEFGTIDAGILGTKTYSVSPYVYWASNGALVLDYAVSPDVSAGVPSWWEQNYGDKPDLTFVLPWKYDQEKGIGSTNPEVQKEETRDIIFDPLNPQPGELVTVMARVQNFSLKDQLATSSLRFYLGDPRSGGTLLINESGESVIEIPAVRARQNQIVRLTSWRVPQGIGRDSKIYAVIDEENSVDEVHENNNIAWSLINPELGAMTSVTENELLAPHEFELGQNYPNPFNPQTTIRFALASAQRVELVVHNLLGQVVAVLVNEVKSAGVHHVKFSASDLPGGVYFYSLIAEGRREMRKMVVVR